MSGLWRWIDQRTGIPSGLRWFLYESVPGGARWRHAWGTMLLFAFIMQVVTGFFLFASYSGSSQSAWESIYYLQYQTPGGWLLRGLHSFNAQLFVVLLALHILQTVLYRAYLAPREVNFWLLLLLIPLAMGMSVTGWLLPLDQKGLWAARVPLNILGIVPVTGPVLQRLLLGGGDISHHTVTRFLALHTWFLPLMVGSVLGLQWWLSRRNKPEAPARGSAVESTYWPDQFLRDAVACLAVFATAVFLVLRPRLMDPAGGLGVELGAPADPTEQFSAARPEWFMLFLFQFLKSFPGGTEILGAVVIPTLAMGVMALMPWFGRWDLGRRFNAAFILGLVGAWILLTSLAILEDRDNSEYQSSLRQARVDAERSRVLAGAPAGIPPTGALSLVRSDPLFQGPKLFARHCASCHRYQGHDGTGRVPGERETASDLYGFASRSWLTGLLDPKRIAGIHYLGGTKFRAGKMTKFVTKDVGGFSTEEQARLRDVIAALSAEASLPSQQKLDAADAKQIASGRAALADAKLIRCTECHMFHKKDEDATAPDLTGYGSREWLVSFLTNPAHDRFYGGRNDRMPSFGQEQILDAASLGLIADWLRGDWYEPSVR